MLLYAIVNENWDFSLMEVFVFDHKYIKHHYKSVVIMATDSVLFVAYVIDTRLHAYLSTSVL